MDVILLAFIYIILPGERCIQPGSTVDRIKLWSLFEIYMLRHLLWKVRTVLYRTLHTCTVCGASANCAELDVTLLLVNANRWLCRWSCCPSWSLSCWPPPRASCSSTWWRWRRRRTGPPTSAGTSTTLSPASPGKRGEGVYIWFGSLFVAVEQDGSEVSFPNR